MFDNIAKLRFEQGSSQEPLANAMISGEGEMMEYRQGIVAEGKVEDWMTLVLNEMRRTNQIITKEAIYHYCSNKSRQVSARFQLLTQIWWLGVYIGLSGCTTTRAW